MDSCYFIPSSPDLHWQPGTCSEPLGQFATQSNDMSNTPSCRPPLGTSLSAVEGALRPAALIHSLSQPLQMFTHFMIPLSQKKETEEQSKTRVLPAVTISTICCFPECRR